MADTFTAHYGWTKPSVGGDPDTWGGLLNTDLDGIDTTVFTVSGVANAALPKAGGTMTGGLSIAPTSGSAGLNLQSVAGANQNAIFGIKGSNTRWSLILGDSTTESGSNAGSNFGIGRFADNGVQIDLAVSINRATGQTTFSQRPIFVAATPWDSANLNPSNYALLAGASFVGPVVVGNDNTENLPLDIHISTGRIVLGNNSGSNSMQSINTANSAITPMSYVASAHNFTGGNCTAPDFIATSDMRLKDNVRPLRRGLAELKKMLPREYDKFENVELIGPHKEEIGFLAQEVEKVVPEAVQEHNGLKHVSYGQLVALLARAIIELDHRMSLEGF